VEYLAARKMRPKNLVHFLKAPAVGICTKPLDSARDRRKHCQNEAEETHESP
jgi:hypothetical protein